MSKLYNVPVGCELYGYVTVEANSWEEARDIAWSDDFPLPDLNDLDYLPSTWYVDEDKLADMYYDEEDEEDEQ